MLNLGDRIRDNAPVRYLGVSEDLAPCSLCHRAPRDDYRWQIRLDIGGEPMLFGLHCLNLILRDRLGFTLTGNFHVARKKLKAWLEFQEAEGQPLTRAEFLELFEAARRDDTE